jgi:hypothetical protein
MMTSLPPPIRGKPTEDIRMRPMTVKDQDVFNNAVDKLRALRMALAGAESIVDQGEADALLSLATDALCAFEAVQASIESAPMALAA